MSEVQFTAMVKRGDKWDAVGTRGSYDHARSELADWMRDCPDDDFAIARRVVPRWQVIKLYSAKERES
jgi:hypothetical protein